MKAQGPMQQDIEIASKEYGLISVENSIENLTLKMGWPELKMSWNFKLDELKKPQPSPPLKGHM